MWDNFNSIKIPSKFVKIPDDFDLYSLVMPDDLKEKYKEEKEKEEKNSIDEVIGGMLKLEINSIFEKYIPKNDWYPFFYDELVKDYFKNIIEKKYKLSLDSDKEVFPQIENIFRAFSLTSIKMTKVIIIGQDPYPGICKKSKTSFANGLAFSVNKECNIPASLRNMYKELERSGFEVPETGELESWAQQGVFLLNTQLSVEKKNPNSHKFWKKFTDNAIKYLCKENPHIVFVLMGGTALKKKKIIPKNSNFVITSHPSPLGYKKQLQGYPPFFESNIFVNINIELRRLGQKEIKW